MSTSSGHLEVRVDRKELLCRNKCGEFYGNPQWDGYCSKCYREYQVAVKRQHDYDKNRSLLSFDRYGEKRKSQMTAEKRSSALKTILKTGPLSAFESTSGGQPTRQTGSRSQTPRQQAAVPAPRSASPETIAARDKFLQFLQELPRPLAHELSAAGRHAVDRLQTHSTFATGDDLSEMVQELYLHVGEKLAAMAATGKDHDKQLTHSVEEMLEQLEDFVCTTAYESLFCPSTDEEVADVSLQERIRSLHWVTAGFLETAVDFSRHPAREALDCAIVEMVDVNRPRSVREKLEGLQRCCDFIFDALRMSRDGLAGYYYTNLCCALKFVQNLNADSLKMARDEFEAYTCGSAAPPITERGCVVHQALKAMQKSLDDLDELDKRREQLRLRMEQFAARTKRETDAVLAEIRAFDRAHPVDPFTVEAILRDLERVQFDDDGNECPAVVAAADVGVEAETPADSQTEAHEGGGAYDDDDGHVDAAHQSTQNAQSATATSSGGGNVGDDLISFEIDSSATAEKIDSQTSS